jgi:hypothetical protein
MGNPGSRRRRSSPRSRARTCERHCGASSRQQSSGAMPFSLRSRTRSTLRLLQPRGEHAATGCGALSTRTPAPRVRALHTGARAGEQLAPQWGNIDFRSNLVVFRRSSTRGVVGRTKSGREARSRLLTRAPT